MRKLSILLALAMGFGLVSIEPISAAPINNSAIIDSVNSQSPVQEARLYCHRGPVFLHWGPCRHDAWRYGYGGYGYHRHYYHRHYYHRHYWHRRYW